MSKLSLKQGESIKISPLILMMTDSFQPKTILIMNAETLHKAICEEYRQLLTKGFDNEIENYLEMILYISVKSILKDLFVKITHQDQLERHLEGNCEDR